MRAIAHIDSRGMWMDHLQTRVIQNLSRVGGHLFRSSNHQLLRFPIFYGLARGNDGLTKSHAIPWLPISEHHLQSQLSQSAACHR